MTPTTRSKTDVDRPSSRLSDDTLTGWLRTMDKTFSVLRMKNSSVDSDETVVVTFEQLLYHSPPLGDDL